MFAIPNNNYNICYTLDKLMVPVVRQPHQGKAHNGEVCNGREDVVGRKVLRLCRAIGCKAKHCSKRGCSEQEDLQSIGNSGVP